MTTSSLWTISIVTAHEAGDAVAAMVERIFGKSPASYAGAQAARITTTIYDARPLHRARRRELCLALQGIKACGLDVRPASILCRKLPREDWSETWKKHFKAISIGSRLLIKPSWSKKRPRIGQVVVVLDPGLSFGTGQHPTTAFCLAQLVEARDGREQQSFWDIGTGSGILAIAGAKLGYSPVRAFDFDPVAVGVATANARRNRVDQRVMLSCQDLTRLPKKSGTQYDVICANLTDDLLMAQSDRIVNRLKPTGRLILAGVLGTQFEAVREAFEMRGLALVSSRQEGEWHSGAFARSSVRVVR